MRLVLAIVGVGVLAVTLPPEGDLPPEGGSYRSQGTGGSYRSQGTGGSYRSQGTGGSYRGQGTGGSYRSQGTGGAYGRQGTGGSEVSGGYRAWGDYGGSADSAQY